MKHFNSSLLILPYLTFMVSTEPPIIGLLSADSIMSLAQCASQCGKCYLLVHIKKVFENLSSFDGAFSALTLLVGRQERHPARKNF